MKTNGFPKPEHLTLQRDIDALFAGGSHSAVAFPVRAVWREVEWDGHGPRVKVLVSVSKRKFKHAVDRNRAKRQMREAYRLNKHILSFNQPADALRAPLRGVLGGPSSLQGVLGGLHIGFIWVADAPQKSSLIHKRITNLLKRIEESCSNVCS
ncbi:MAG: ribonuclease P protein component [Bacteroidales bacterium]|nr:ribonuclease P protein component [Bacteroidales bacterium]